MTFRIYLKWALVETTFLSILNYITVWRIILLINYKATWQKTSMRRIGLMCQSTNYITCCHRILTNINQFVIVNVRFLYIPRKPIRSNYDCNLSDTVHSWQWINGTLNYCFTTGLLCNNLLTTSLHIINTNWVILLLRTPYIPSK